MNNSQKKFYWLIVLVVVALFFGIDALVQNLAADNQTAAPAAGSLEKEQAASGAIQWHPYKEGLAMADDQGKKIYLYFFSDHCPYCVVMDNKTFSDQQTVAFLNKKFTPIRLNTSDNQSLAAKYNVPGVPLSVFLEQDGEMIGSQPGYLPPEEFMKVLEFVDAEAYKE